MIWHLPGPQHFVEGIGRALTTSQHVVVALPESISAPDLCRAVGDWLRRLKHGALTITDVDATQSPEANLASVLGTSRHRTLESLLRFEDAPSRVIVLRAGHLTPDANRPWVDFLRRLADASHQVDWASYQLLLVGGVGWIDTPCDTHLSVSIWWGMCSPLDVDIMLDASLSEDFSQRATHAFWIRALCRGLVPDDPGLVPHLADAMPRSIDEIQSVLLSFGERRTGVASRVSGPTGRLGFLDVCCPAFPKDAESRRAWSVGAMNWVPGLGREAHILAVVDDLVEVRRRVWRGQLEVFLPLVERVRQWLIGRLVVRWGDEWLRVLIDKTQAVGRESDDIEIGPLAHCLSGVKHRGSRPLAAVARRWREVRNALAHGELVSFELVCAAFEAVRNADPE